MKQSYYQIKPTIPFEPLIALPLISKARALKLPTGSLSLFKFLGTYLLPPRLDLPANIWSVKTCRSKWKLTWIFNSLGPQMFQQKQSKLSLAKTDKPTTFRKYLLHVILKYCNTIFSLCIFASWEKLFVQLFLSSQPKKIMCLVPVICTWPYWQETSIKHICLFYLNNPITCQQIV